MTLTAKTYSLFAPNSNWAVREYCGQDLSLRAMNPKFDAIKPDTVS